MLPVTLACALTLSILENNTHCPQVFQREPLTCWPVKLMTSEKVIKKEAGSFVHPNPFGASFSYKLTTNAKNVFFFAICCLPRRGNLGYRPAVGGGGWAGGEAPVGVVAGGGRARSRAGAWCRKRAGM